MKGGRDDMGITGKCKSSKQMVAVQTESEFYYLLE